MLPNIYYESDKEYYKQLSRGYYCNNKEHHKKVASDYYQNNKKHILEHKKIIYNNLSKKRKNKKLYMQKSSIIIYLKIKKT